MTQKRYGAKWKTLVTLLSLCSRTVPLRYNCGSLKCILVRRLCTLTFREQRWLEHPGLTPEKAVTLVTFCVFAVPVQVWR